jgi:hypothetical protein
LTYRDQVARRCFEHAGSHGDVSLVLYDAATLYFEAEKEDDLRKIGFSNYAEVVIMPTCPSTRWCPCRSAVWEGAARAA